MHVSSSLLFPPSRNQVYDSQKASSMSLSRRERGWDHKEKEMGRESMKTSSSP